MRVRQRAELSRTDLLLLQVLVQVKKLRCRRLADQLSYPSISLSSSHIQTIFAKDGKLKLPTLIR